MAYDPEMELGYEEGAAAFDVEITVIDPDTGKSNSATVDNLTNAMYWIVGHNLLPIREGYRPRESKDFDLHYGEPPSEDASPESHLVHDMAKSLHAQWRAENLHEIILTITCHGDPELVAQGM
jgi:hypothetical protein